MAFRSIGTLASDVLGKARIERAAARQSAARIEGDGPSQPGGQQNDPSRLSGDEGTPRAHCELGKMGDAETPPQVCPDKGGQPGLSGSKSHTFGNATPEAPGIVGAPNVAVAYRATNRPALRVISGGKGKPRHFDPHEGASAPRRLGFPLLLVVEGHATPRERKPPIPKPGAPMATMLALLE